MKPTALANVNLVIGKGGVGKSTVAVGLALACAKQGFKTLLVVLEDRDEVRGMLGLESARISFDEIRVEEGLDVRLITPDEALLDYLEEHGMKRMARRLQSAGLVEVVATAVPGIRDILVLGKIKQIERRQLYDVVVVDCAASGQSLEFLRSAKGLLQSARGGPVRLQAEEVVEMLTSHERSQAVLVTVPEETPVNETIETAYALEDEVGIRLGFCVVNMVLDPNNNYPRLLEAARDEMSWALPAIEFLAARAATQAEHLERLRKMLPLPTLLLPDTLLAEQKREQAAYLAELLRQFLLKSEREGTALERIT